MKLNKTDALHDRNNLNGINNNWVEIENNNDYTNVKIETVNKEISEIEKINEEHIYNANIILNTAQDTNLENKEVQAQLDNLIIESGNANAEVTQAREGHPLLKDRINSVETKLEDNLNSRGILATQPPVGYDPVVADGITDNTEALNRLLADFSYVVLPAGEYIVKDTIVVGRNGKSLVGTVDTTRNYNKTARIKYDGLEDNRKAVILMGRNGVGEEPTYDGSNNQIKNINVDCNYKAGFGIYGTYMTNESIVDNMTVKGSLEYNFYFAKAWYGTIKGLTSLNCKNVGIALGVPLIYLDGSETKWLSANNLEMNNLFIRDLRSFSSGEHFSIDSAVKFNPTNDYNKGYGLAVGVGNGMNVDNITVEKSGGVNMYCLTGTQPVKSIENGYMEKPCHNSNLTQDELVNIFIEHTSEFGGSYDIKDIYIMPKSGGILFKGKKRPVKLINIHSPSFLKSWENHYEKLVLYSIVLKDNVHYDCGYYNYNEAEFTQTYRGKHDTRYSYKADLTSLKGKFRVVFVKLVGDKAMGAMKVNKSSDGSSYDVVFPDSLNKDSFVFSHIQSGLYDSITKGGDTEFGDGNVEFMIYDIPTTYIG